MAKVHLSAIFALTILFGIGSPVWAQTDAQRAPSPTPAAAISPANPEDSTHLTIISDPEPIYPMAAAKKSLQGKVWIHLVISETGDVESADIISGDPDLANAALEAMKKWKFKPYIHNGKPVKVNTKMPFDFAFKDKITDAKAPDDSSTTAPAAAGDSAGTFREGTGNPLPQKLRVSAKVAEGLKLHDVTPVYPPEARMNHIEGEVLLEATIGKDGLIHALKVLKGPPVLAEAAKGAVEQWRYRPYLLQGNPVEVETTVKVVFSMR